MPQTIDDFKEQQGLLHLQLVRIISVSSLDRGVALADSVRMADGIINYLLGMGHNIENASSLYHLILGEIIDEDDIFSEIIADPDIRKNFEGFIKGELGRKENASELLSEEGNGQSLSFNDSDEPDNQRPPVSISLFDDIDIAEESEGDFVDQMVLDIFKEPSVEDDDDNDDEAISDSGNQELDLLGPNPHNTRGVPEEIDLIKKNAAVEGGGHKYDSSNMLSLLMLFKIQRILGKPSAATCESYGRLGNILGFFVNTELLSIPNRCVSIEYMHTVFSRFYNNGLRSSYCDGPIRNVFKEWTGTMSKYVDTYRKVESKKSITGKNKEIVAIDRVITVIQYVHSALAEDVRKLDKAKNPGSYEKPFDGMGQSERAQLGMVVNLMIHRYKSKPEAASSRGSAADPHASQRVGRAMGRNH